jgi:hypothetical protein
MNVPMIRISTVVLTATLAATAHAEYRCDSPSTPNDRQACAAAAQGPEALRRYIMSWPSQIANLQFSDYVDSNTERAWDMKRKAAIEEPAPFLIASSDQNDQK